VADRSNVTVTGPGSYHDPCALKLKFTVTGPGSYHEPVALIARLTVTGPGLYVSSRALGAAGGSASGVAVLGSSGGVGATVTGAIGRGEAVAAVVAGAGVGAGVGTGAGTGAGVTVARGEVDGNAITVDGD
jgi:hypothetical protein